MNSDPLVSQTASLVFKSLVKIALLLVLGGFVCLGLWLILLSKLTVCNSDFLACGLVISTLVLLAVVVPLILLWGARGYVLLKVLYEVYHANETTLLHQAATLICNHRQSFEAFENFKSMAAFNKVPLPVRLLLRHLDLKPLSDLLKNNPNLTPAALVPFLQERVKTQGLLQKPSLTWFWAPMLGVISVCTGLWWWL